MEQEEISVAAGLLVAVGGCQLTAGVEQSGSCLEMSGHRVAAFVATAAEHFAQHTTTVTSDTPADTRRVSRLEVPAFLSELHRSSVCLLLNQITTPHRDMHLQNNCETTAVRNQRDSEGNLSKPCGQITGRFIQTRRETHVKSQLSVTFA